MNTNEQTIHQMGLGINSLVKQATGRESVSSIDMDWVSVEQLARYIYGSGSGDVVSFNTNIPDAIDSLIAYITAVQDLHGYDNPWPGGGGKNYLKFTIQGCKSTNTSGTWNGNTYAWRGRSFKLNSLDGVSVSSIDISGAPDSGSYPMINSDTFTLPVGTYTFTKNIRCRVYKNGSQVTDSSSGDVTITVESESDVYYISIFPGGDEYTGNVVVMIRLASVTDDSFEPYSNICPITGWTGCTITDANMLDSSDPDYEAKTYAFTFPDESGTVYGAMLDVLSGVLTVDKIISTLDNLTTADIDYSSSSKTFYAKSASVNWCPGMKCEAYTKGFTGSSNKFKAYPGNSVVPWANMKECCVGYISDSRESVRFSIPYKTAVDQDVVDILNGTEILYELAEPLTFQLTAQEVTALIGQNNIFADTGKVSVEYKVKEDLV